MKYNLDNLYVNMPEEEYPRVFDLPEDIYSNPQIAESVLNVGERTYTLREAFERVARDIHEDS